MPQITDTISKVPGHIIVVVSPLINLMKEQVGYLRNIGISSVSLSSINDEEAKDVEQGKFSVVYTTPEVLIKNERWRKTLSSSVYASKLLSCVLLQWTRLMSLRFKLIPQFCIAHFYCAHPKTIYCIIYQVRGRLFEARLA